MVVRLFATLSDYLNGNTIATSATFALFLVKMQLMITVGVWASWVVMGSMGYG